jgi:hypothetical protein
MFRKKEQKPVNQFVVDNFSNAQIEEILLSRDIASLEDAIEIEQSQFTHLQDLKRKGELDFGLRPKEINLQQVYFDLKRDITSLLGVSPNMPDPKFRMNNSFNFPAVGLTLMEGTGLLHLGVCSLAILYGVDISPESLAIAVHHVALGEVGRRASLKFGSMYNPKNKKMMLGQNPEATVVPTFAHELDHHVLSEVGVPYQAFSKSEKSYTLFQEGHAQGVQRVISKQFFEGRRNEAFLYDSSKLDLIMLKKTYGWLCKKNKLQPKTELATGKTFKGMNRVFYSLFDSSERHVRGSAFFYLLEQEQGTDVYKNTLRDPKKVVSFKDLK